MQREQRWKKKLQFQSNGSAVLFIPDRDPTSEFLVGGGLDTCIEWYFDVYWKIEASPIGRIVSDLGSALRPGRVARQKPIEV
jgi:hypothetical protein